MRVFEPKVNRFPGTATLVFLLDPFVWDGAGGQIAADLSGTTFVMVYDVPNQPLWDRREDPLLGYSIEQSVRFGDPTWSLAFPMTRSVVRSMDAVQSWSARRPAPIKRFVLIGFSKRALAAWLASTDKRVAALVSLGYNNLNLPAQAKLQRSDWGALSQHWDQMVAPNFERQLETPKGNYLTSTWDPNTFLPEIRVPKLLVDATNNDYWSLDAPSQFAGRLQGPTNWLFFANSGHYMESAVWPMVQTSASWIRRTLARQSVANPVLSVEPTRCALNAPGARSATLFCATSATRDFRDASWTSVPLKREGSSWSAPRPKGGQGFVAIFGQADYPARGEAGPMQLSSLVTILPAS